MNEYNLYLVSCILYLAHTEYMIEMSNFALCISYTRISMCRYIFSVALHCIAFDVYMYIRYEYYYIQ